MAVLKENYWQSFVGETIRGNTAWSNVYHIQKFLGRGEFGGVFKAEQDDPKQLVAVKLMLPADAAAREIKTALQVPEHRNLVKHFEAIEANVKGTPMYVLVMELGDGGSLRDLLNHRILNGLEVKKIAIDIAEGLKHLHSIDATGSEEKKLVHRDMKPENVLQINGVWKIADFGLAKVLENGSMQASETAGGTPQYMPPELLQHPHIVSTKWDIWSLGVILVEMLARERPFDSYQSDAHERRNDIDRKILAAKPNIPNVPKEWLPIVEGCLVKKYKTRWTAAQILVELPKITSECLSIPEIQENEKTQLAKIKHKKSFADQGSPSIVGKIALIVNIITVITLFATSFYRNQDGTCYFSFNLLCEMVTDRQKLAQNFYNNGLLKYRNKDFNGAIADHRKAIEIKPDYADAYMELGNIYSDIGEPQNAVDNYTKVIQYNPNSAEAYNRRGLITLRRIDQQSNYTLEDINKLEQAAINDYNKAIYLQPDYAIAYNNRGAFYRLKDNQVKAIADFDAAIKSDPKYALAYYNRALSHNILRKDTEAVADFQNSIKFDPNHLDSYYELGKKWVELMQYDQAVKILDELILLRANYISAYYYRAQARHKLGNKDGAIADYDQYIKAKPNDHKAYFERGFVKNDQKDYRGAIADWQAAIRLNSALADAYLYYLQGSANYNLGNKKEAIPYYDAAIRLDPNYSNAYFGRGKARYDSGEQDRAIEDYTEAIRLNPNDAELFNHRGSALYNYKNDKERAVLDFTKAIELNPNFALAYDNRGLANSILGKKEAAFLDHSKAIQIDPNYASYYYNRGNVLNDLGRKEDAKADFLKASELWQQQGNTEWYNKSRDKI